MDDVLISGRSMTLYKMGIVHKVICSQHKRSFLNINKDMYSKSSCTVKVSDKRAPFFDYRKGVRQACSLSPMLFNKLFSIR